MRRPIAVPILIMLLLVTPALADDVLEETWERVHLGGGRAGFAHSVVRQVVTPEGRRIQTVTHQEISINRLGSTIEIVTDEVTTETLAGSLVAIESRAKTSGQLTETVYRFDGRTVKVERSVLGTTRESEVELPEGVLGPYAIKKRMIELAGTSGVALELLTFTAEFGVAVRVTATSKGMEAVPLLDGRTTALTQLDSVLQGLPLQPVTWTDASGEALKTESRIAGMHIETYRVEDEAAARRTSPEDAAPAPDAFKSSLVYEPGPIPVPRHLEAAIRMRCKTKEAGVPSVESAAHTVHESEAGTWIIEAKRLVPPANATAPRPLSDPPKELADALAPNSMIQSDAQEILEVAKKVVGDEPHAWRAAQKLERWVYENLFNKGFGVASASALEVYRNREADCTEHAVLLAALCRAAGIPARVVMGVEYLIGIWGGHAWNEVWIDVIWYALDATNGFGHVDPLHLSWAHMTLADASIGLELGRMLTALGNIELDVIEVTHAARRIYTNAPTMVDIEGDLYEDRVWVIRFRAPKAYEFDPPEPQRMSPELITLQRRTASDRVVEISIAALDAPATGAWSDIGTMLGIDPTTLEATEVDGRPARRRTETRDGRSVERVAVLSGDALFLISMEPVEGAAERDAFEAFLASVDFD